MPYKDPAKKAEYMLDWQDSHRDKVRAANKRWSAKNPEAIRAIKTRYNRARGTTERGSPEYVAKLSANMTRRYPWPQRFWDKVNKAGPVADGMTTPCWLWTANRIRGNYGVIRFEGKQRKAHRISYEWAKGPIPDGLQIDHLCFVPACVNPEHLEAVTPTENLRRRRQR